MCWDRGRAGWGIGMTSSASDEESYQASHLGQGIDNLVVICHCTSSHIDSFSHKTGTGFLRAKRLMVSHRVSLTESVPLATLSTTNCAHQSDTSLILYSTVTGFPASRMKRPEPTKTLFSRTLSSGWPVSNLT